MPFGAEPLAQGRGFRFALRAPSARTVELHWWPAGRSPKTAPVRLGGVSGADGWFRVDVADARAGDHYRYRIDDAIDVPDIASRWQPDDVDGTSVLVDARQFAWTDGAWTGRPFAEAVIYELHVGTFSPDGDFDGVRAQLAQLAALGITAIELMPLAETPGRRGWGYDGVLPFAPESAYGTPEQLRRLVDAAHATGLMVFVDVVYNHLGPQGNYLHRYDRSMFDAQQRTPWGDALTFDDEAAGARALFLHNALYWLVEFHVDGLRLDAVHAIADGPRQGAFEARFVAHLRRAIAAGPGRHRHIHLILENEANEALLLERDDGGTPLVGTAQWNDDVHHALHVLLTGEREGYYADFADDPIVHLGIGLTEGFVFQGQRSGHLSRDRGSPSAHLSPLAFVNSLQTHDQVGNRALGERITALADDASVRLASACVLLAPSPPMLFMGEEFGASTPFLYFVDFDEPLAGQVRDGRRMEFAAFSSFANRDVPDPTDPRTFAASRLDPHEGAREPHRAWLEHYRAALAFRHRLVVPWLAALADRRHARIDSAHVHRVGPRALHVQWRTAAGTFHAVLNFSATESARVPCPARPDDVPWAARSFAVGRIVAPTPAPQQATPPQPVPPPATPLQPAPPQAAVPPPQLPGSPFPQPAPPVLTAGPLSGCWWFGPPAS